MGCSSSKATKVDDKNKKGLDPKGPDEPPPLWTGDGPKPGGGLDPKGVQDPSGLQPREVVDPQQKSSQEVDDFGVDVTTGSGKFGPKVQGSALNAGTLTSTSVAEEGASASGGGGRWRKDAPEGEGASGAVTTSAAATSPSLLDSKKFGQPGAEDQVGEVAAIWSFDPSSLDWNISSFEPLKFEANDHIVVLATPKKAPKGWGYGYLAGHPDRKGLFPENYVEDADATPSSGRSRSSYSLTTGVLPADWVVAAVCEFDADSVEFGSPDLVALPLRTGLRLRVKTMPSELLGSGWLYGHPVDEPEKCGLFPATYVKRASASEQVFLSRLNSMGAPLEVQDEQQAKARLEQAAESTPLRLALYDFDPAAVVGSRPYQDEEFLPLQRGQTVVLKDFGGDLPPGWSYGELLENPSKRGLFPTDYVGNEGTTSANQARGRLGTTVHFGKSTAEKNEDLMNLTDKLSEPLLLQALEVVEGLNSNDDPLKVTLKMAGGVLMAEDESTDAPTTAASSESHLPDEAIALLDALSSTGKLQDEDFKLGVEAGVRSMVHLFAPDGGNVDPATGITRNPRWSIRKKRKEAAAKELLEAQQKAKGQKGPDGGRLRSWSFCYNPRSRPVEARGEGRRSVCSWHASSWTLDLETEEAAALLVVLEQTVTNLGASDSYLEGVRVGVLQMDAMLADSSDMDGGSEGEGLKGQGSKAKAGKAKGKAKAKAKSKTRASDESLSRGSGHSSNAAAASPHSPSNASQQQKSSKPKAKRDRSSQNVEGRPASRPQSPQHQRGSRNAKEREKVLREALRGSQHSSDWDTPTSNGDEDHHASPDQRVPRRVSQRASALMSALGSRPARTPEKTSNGAREAPENVLRAMLSGNAMTATETGGQQRQQQQHSQHSPQQQQLLQQPSQQLLPRSSLRKPKTSTNSIKSNPVGSNNSAGLNGNSNGQGSTPTGASKGMVVTSSYASRRQPRIGSRTRSDSASSSGRAGSKGRLLVSPLLGGSPVTSDAPPSSSPRPSNDATVTPSPSQPTTPTIFALEEEDNISKGGAREREGPRAAAEASAGVRSPVQPGSWEAQAQHYSPSTLAASSPEVTSPSSWRSGSKGRKWTRSRTITSAGSATPSPELPPLLPGTADQSVFKRGSGFNKSSSTWDVDADPVAPVKTAPSKSPAPPLPPDQRSYAPVAAVAPWPAPARTTAAAETGGYAGFAVTTPSHSPAPTPWRQRRVQQQQQQQQHHQPRQETTQHASAPRPPDAAPPPIRRVWTRQAQPQAQAHPQAQPAPQAAAPTPQRQAWAQQGGAGRAQPPGNKAKARDAGLDVPAATKQRKRNSELE